MSDIQLDALSDTYSRFIPNPKTSPDFKTDLKCNVYRLEQALDISLHELSVDCQYAPRKVWRANTLGLTGYNFLTSVRFRQHPKIGLLGVADEHELAQQVVFENFLRILAAQMALEQGGVVLHSAGLVFEQQAYIFVGRSGAGKTTITRKAYQAGKGILSDDINLLLPENEGFQAHAVPFSGDFGRVSSRPDDPESFPLAAVVLMHPGDRLKTETVTASEAVARLMVGSPFVNDSVHESDALFDALTNLVSRVPVCKLGSRREDPIEDIVKAIKSRICNDIH